MIFLLADLPNGIAPPVHILDLRYNQDVRNWILLPILLITLYWLYRYFKSMQREIQKRKPKFPPEPIEVLKQKIETIHNQYSENRRSGLHELSSTMKKHFESKMGIDIEEMTSEEISRRVKDKNITNFFLKLALLQFGKQHPEKEDFDEIFYEAKIASGIRKTKQNEKPKSNEIVRPS
ncbi:MAG TPA: hypothetical protein PK079_04650 [Leptospiraceae bacterium]|nr:hypothetical protein [Leptospiraceae bacterium]HMW04947.1 hypothetical protein [Leptospiraceae bacterium]HMX31904.1 hypothetical protein [Leptospiraceae bacterium]HMY30832.1 hypothetical protein [Leptospiraceae bacterium]HMZ64293.1 hypothetical protein [Leptospiraceae bacterium]